MKKSIFLILFIVCFLNIVKTADVETLSKQGSRGQEVINIQNKLKSLGFYTGKVDGMLLYAKTQTEIQPNGDFKTNDGNVLMVRTLDLSLDFENIKAELDTLINYQV